MATLTLAHWAYLAVTVLLFILIICKKEIIVASIAGILAVAFLVTKDIPSAVQAMCRAVLSGFTELLPIFIGISLILAMTNALKESGATEILSGITGNKVMGPRKSYIHWFNYASSFFSYLAVSGGCSYRCTCYSAFFKDKA